MTFDKWKLKDFLTIDEVARRLSEESKDDTKVSWSDVLSLALDGHLPLVVKIPPLTFVYPQEAPKDGRRPTIEGIWSLVMKGQRGSSARRSIDHSYRRLADLPPANDEGIGGVWVERDGEQWQLDPYGRLPKEVLENPVALHALTSQHRPVPRGCILGARTGAVEKLLAQEISSYKKPVEAEWTDVTITFPSERQVQMKIGDRMLPACTSEELQDAGFWDRHAKRPTKAWQTLVYLAQRDGTVAASFGDRRRVEARMGEIRKKLRAYLTSAGIDISDANPLPYDRHTRTYTAEFTIGVGPHFT